MKSFKDRYPKFDSKSMKLRKSPARRPKINKSEVTPILNLSPRLKSKKDFYEYKIGYRGEWLLYRNSDVFKAFSSEAELLEFCDKLNILAIKA